MNEDVFTRYFQACEEAGQLASLAFELTDACNFSCAHCYRVHGETFLTRAIFEKALREAGEMGALFISFNGGEPTLHPEFVDFARMVLTRGMHLTVLTNAYRLTDEVLAALSAWAPNVHFQVSLYGVDDFSAQQITGVAGAYGRALERAQTAQGMGFSVKVALLALAATADGMRQVTQRLKDAGLYYDMMLYFTAREDGDVQALSLAPPDERLPELLALRPEVPWGADPLDPAMPEVVPEGLACGAGTTGLGVRADGRVVPCLVFDRWPILGHLPQDRLQDVFAGKARDAFLRRNRMPEKCLACSWQRDCPRCPASVLFETGDIQGVPERICRLARIVTAWREGRDLSAGAP